MMKVLIIMFLFLSVSGCNSQEMQPEEIAKLYFSEDTTGISQYLCCDVTKVPVKSSDLDYPTVETELIQYDSLNTVVATNLTLDTTSTDVYLFFRYDKGWKLASIHSLKWKNFNLKAIEINENLPKNAVDTLIATGNWEKMQYMISQLRLISSSDKNVIEYFRKNKHKFDKFLSTVVNEVPSNNTYSIEDNDSSNALTSIAKELYIAEISRDKSPISTDTPGIIYFLFGGVLDNSMGFMHVNESASLPKLNKNGFIAIREIGDGWYLFKSK